MGKVRSLPGFSYLTLMSRLWGLMDVRLIIDHLWDNSLLRGGSNWGSKTKVFNLPRRTELKLYIERTCEMSSIIK